LDGRHNQTEGAPEDCLLAPRRRAVAVKIVKFVEFVDTALINNLMRGNYDLKAATVTGQTNGLTPNLLRGV
jgi:hypothetical protein